MAALSCAVLARADVRSAIYDSLTLKDKQASTSALAASSPESSSVVRSLSAVTSSPSSSLSCSHCKCLSLPFLASGESTAKNLPRSRLKLSSAAGPWNTVPLSGRLCTSMRGSSRRLAPAAEEGGGRGSASWVRNAVAYPAAGDNATAVFNPSLISGVHATQAAPSQQSMAESDVMGLLLRERIVILGHQVDDFVADTVISQLLLLDAQDPRRDIRLFVNCPGGSINATMGIFDAIQWCRADVSTIAMGIAASTAAIVLMGGTKGKRYAMPNTRIMLHQPLGGASGQVIDVEIQAKEIQYHKDNFVRLISEFTGRAADVVDKDIDRDRYMSPMEAVEYGLIDGVIDKDIIVPLVPMPENILPRPEYIQEYDRSLLFPKLRDDDLF
eukprot:TRINITY_DN669_c0_g1_i3.p1 TRINITY_DN669_c0_g1~~TRINITY_DN669_c0_g1_i3.p1  ORF type:complete len:385 (-),score=54.82 TRINITY_DN669_c0_g1_i3:507-1661(-)